MRIILLSMIFCTFAFKFRRSLYLMQNMTNTSNLLVSKSSIKKQDCNKQRNSLNHTCKIPFSSYRCQVAKKQDAADICRLSVTNALPV